MQRHTRDFARGTTTLRHRPAPPLDQYVECFWWSHRTDAQPYAEHMLPSGRAQLVVALHDHALFYRAGASSAWAAWSRSVVHGPQKRHYVVSAKPRGAVVGVSFRAGCAGPVLGVPASELTGQHVDLDALWGWHAARLRESLLDAAHPETMFRLLEDHLLTRIQGPPRMHPAVAQALAASADGPKISHLRFDAGCSPRHFIAKFTESVGLRPNEYHRLQRFNRVTRRLASSRHVCLADLATSLGYSDQAHLTREFREFAGVPPTSYRADADRPLHLRLGVGVPAPRR